jgi:hypothetical protein
LAAYFHGESILEAMYLGEVELRGRCGGLAATAVRSCLRQHFPPGGCRLSALFPNCCLGLSVPRGSLIGDGLCLLGSRQSTLLLRLQRTCAAFLLVLHAGKCGLTLQSPRGLASEPGEEASAAEPQEDDSGGRRLPCLSGATAKSTPLVKEALATCSLHLTFEGGALVKKTLSCASRLLAGGLLLASTSGVLVEELLAAGSLLAGMSSSSLLAGASGSSLLAGASGLLVEELLAAGSLLAGASSSSLLAGASGSSLLAGASGSGLLAGASGLLVEKLLAASSLLAGASGSSLLAIVGSLVVSCPCRLDHVVKGPFPDHVLPLRSAPLVLGNRTSPGGTFPLHEMCRLVLLHH